MKRKLWDIFSKKKESKTSVDCDHSVTRTSFDIPNEKVVIICCLCGKVLTSLPPEALEKQMSKDARNRLIYAALKRKRS